MGNSNWIYIGPNIPQIGLKKNTLFRGNEPPPKLKELIRQKPVISSLFVPTAALSQAESGVMDHHRRPRHHRRPVPAF